MECKSEKSGSRKCDAAAEFKVTTGYGVSYLCQGHLESFVEAWGPIVISIETSPAGQDVTSQYISR